MNLKSDIENLRFGTDRNMLEGFVAKGDEWFIDGEYNTYTWYRAVAQAVKPQRILETGVRYGYSAIAMICGARLAGVQFPEYIGIDGELDGLETNDIAGRNIRKSGPVIGRILKCDTRDLKETEHLLRSLQKQYDGPFEWFDLIHIDGDHRPDGIAAELLLARYCVALNGAILVDDCDVEHVKAAALELAYTLHAEYTILPTTHQTMLIEVTD